MLVHNPSPSGFEIETPLELLREEAINHHQVKRYRTPRQPLEPGVNFEYGLDNSDPNWRMRIKSVIFAPSGDEKTHVAKLRNGIFIASGVAWNDGTSLIDAVELSLDNGQSWRRAELARAGRYAWQRWQLPLDLPNGKHVLISRAAASSLPPASRPKCLLTSSTTIAWHVTLRCDQEHVSGVLLEVRRDCYRMNTNLATIEDVQAAETIIREHLSRVPLMRSYRLEKELGLSPGRRVWLKDYGWTPVGSFKVFGALNWVAKNFDRIGDQPIAAHSSGNFASGISFAGNRYGKRVIIVMPDTAPKVKFDLTRSYGAEIRTYDIARDHATGERNQLVNQIVDHEGGIQASPYDDNDVIAGNGVGGLEIVEELRRNDREISQFVCQVSGGGLIAGHALAIANGFPQAEIIGVEPDTAADFRQSLAAGNIVRIDQPSGICDGLLSYDVGAHNWPILKRYVSSAVAVPDTDTRRAMSWLYDHHGLRTEPSGAITTAALLTGRVQPTGDGDIVVVISGRNVDDGQFQKWIA